MANGLSTHPASVTKTDWIDLFAVLTGAGAADAVVAGQVPTNSEIVSAVRTGAGAYTIVFRRAFPVLVVAPNASYVGTTVGLSLRCSAIDVTAKSASFVFSVAGTPTDLAATDTAFVTWSVRNSSKNG